MQPYQQSAYEHPGIRHQAYRRLSSMNKAIIDAVTNRMSTEWVHICIQRNVFGWAAKRMNIFVSVGLCCFVFAVFIVAGVCVHFAFFYCERALSLAFLCAPETIHAAPVSTEYQWMQCLFCIPCEKRKRNNSRKQIMSFPVVHLFIEETSTLIFRQITHTTSENEEPLLSPFILSACMCVCVCFVLVNIFSLLVSRQQ